MKRSRLVIPGPAEVVVSNESTTIRVVVENAFAIPLVTLMQPTDGNLRVNHLDCSGHDCLRLLHERLGRYTIDQNTLACGGVLEKESAPCLTWDRCTESHGRPERCRRGRTRNKLLTRSRRLSPIDVRKVPEEADKKSTGRLRFVVTSNNGVHDAWRS